MKKEEINELMLKEYPNLLVSADVAKIRFIEYLFGTEASLCKCTDI